ncbi:MAG: ATPase, T2SS/T4P/T4SS family, partial [Mariprofundaceae bacterium]|nr:ATPase, T2SS/T4P/T4SS family [Mariprofundaceae bacterium]
MKQEASNALISHGLITSDDLHDAQEARKATGHSTLVNLLLSERVQNKDGITNFLASFFKIPIISLSHIQPDSRLIKQYPIDLARKHLCIPIACSGGSVVVGMLDPLDLDRVDELVRIFSKPVRPVFIRKNDFSAHIHAVFHNIGTSTSQLKLNELRQMTGDNVQLIAKLLSTSIVKAVHAQATELWFSPGEENATIRFCFDGRMKTVHEIPLDMHARVILKIRQMAKLEMVGSSKPQKGRCKVRMGERSFILRITIVPDAHGEKATIRILDTGVLTLPLDELGFDLETLPHLDQVIAGDRGMILVAGPERSGRSGTLYAFARHAMQQDRSLITIEDPVEIRVDGATQVQVDVGKGRSFASLLRAALPRNPDVVMVSALNDEETARLAFDAARDQHLFMASIQADRAVKVVRNLIRLGVAVDDIAATLKVVSAQRLIRKLCPHCKAKAILHEDTRHQWGIVDHVNFYAPKGCEQCVQTGFHGYLVVHEVMQVDEEIGQMVISGALPEEIETRARYKGMLTLFEAGMNRAIEGSTSFEEVLGTLPCPENFNLGKRLKFGRVMHLQDPNKAVSEDSIVDTFRKEREQAQNDAVAIDVFGGEPAAEEESKAVESKPVDALEDTRIPEPAETVAPPVETSATEQVRAPLESHRGEHTILLVDDSPTTLQFIKHILTVGGQFSVETADSAEAAWDMLQDWTPNLVITDYMLPDMDGEGLIARIRQTPELASIGTMLMTANREEKEALGGGADAYIGKPTDPEVLLAKAQSIINIYIRFAPQQGDVQKDTAPEAERIRKIQVSTAQFEQA